jgi:hypothetical protein
MRILFHEFDNLDRIYISESFGYNDLKLRKWSWLFKNYIDRIYIPLEQIDNVIGILVDNFIHSNQLTDIRLLLFNGTKDYEPVELFYTASDKTITFMENSHDIEFPVYKLNEFIQHLIDFKQEITK